MYHQSINNESWAGLMPIPKPKAESWAGCLSAATTTARKATYRERAVWCSSWKNELYTCGMREHIDFILAWPGAQSWRLCTESAGLCRWGYPGTLGWYNINSMSTIYWEVVNSSIDVNHTFSNTSWMHQPCIHALSISFQYFIVRAFQCIQNISSINQ